MAFYVASAFDVHIDFGARTTIELQQLYVRIRKVCIELHTQDKHYACGVNPALRFLDRISEELMTRYNQQRHWDTVD